MSHTNDSKRTAVILLMTVTVFVVLLLLLRNYIFNSYFQTKTDVRAVPNQTTQLQDGMYRPMAGEFIEPELVREILTILPDFPMFYGFSEELLTDKTPEGYSITFDTIVAPETVIFEYADEFAETGWETEEYRNADKANEYNLTAIRRGNRADITAIQTQQGSHVTVRISNP